MTVETSDTVFSDVYEYPYFPDDKHARDANLLALPIIEDEETGYYFTEYGDEFIRYIRQTEHDGIIFDVAMIDDEYQVVIKHFDLVDLGIFIIKDVLLSSFINLVCSFVYDKFMSSIKKEPEVELKLKVISQSNSGKAVEATYCGPVSGLECISDVLSKAVGQ